MEAQEWFVHFIERAQGLEIREKIKLLLFLQGAKPATYIIFKDNPQNLEEHYQFKQHLERNKLLYFPGRTKSYEEIKAIKSAKILWDFAGVWTGYDFFSTRAQQRDFRQYTLLLEEGQLTEADKIAGALYGYPYCCIKQFIKEKDEEYLQKHYTYWQYFKKQRELDITFPFLFHRPHATYCKPSKALQKEYKKALQEISPRIYKEYTTKRKVETSIIVDDFSDVLVDGMTIWPKKEGFEYEVITRKKIFSKYHLLPFLTKKVYEEGQILETTITFQYNYATIRVLREKKEILKDLQHIRHFPVIADDVFERY